MKFQFSFILLVTIALSSCDESHVMSDSQAFDTAKWRLDHPVVFSFNPPDTINDYNLFINLRNSEKYVFNNIYLISQIKFPEGKTVVDTLEYLMANPQGEFLGKGSRDVFENKLWLKEGVRFRESGTYQLILSHATRKNGEVKGVTELEGILNVGYSIEKQNQSDGNE
ncbi:gliding motility lipoprotein GldH [Nonlabens spongiae]|uniref:Gliding motility lipoprotein GldH n=1 Tax=Nonlabens spongiae TaxID=331648 RepID=A0A1W6MM12_9FLAO|nr:gliding motility lipoprotein GldH [Nonlabens spongiae]ARN78644.1 gliding motility lipoprotein GldH [Nonlabens spongiae]